MTVDFSLKLTYLDIRNEPKMRKNSNIRFAFPTKDIPSNASIEGALTGARLLTSLLSHGSFSIVTLLQIHDPRI